MRLLRIATSLLLLAATASFAQSDAKATFEHLKSLNGAWEGKGSTATP